MEKKGGKEGQKGKKERGKNRGEKRGFEKVLERMKEWIRSSSSFKFPKFNQYSVHTSGNITPYYMKIYIHSAPHVD